ncbi:hypothetical protein AUEXF2481DRAFT_137953 [Aureobasidium subglaciale EXF-2481]|uniref:Uncharacterized protein n=1 Tax=Aureobasidium subglaciale (strain EXF-2481) TaxID=1043005 RepID=A0A074ZQ87_AURSE|nr:uncharacterized protein AUEXF2481DRAFT_137953 [Aureobasidium subglaciale EXF-2481]KER00467.1 hypothetical protein AUEXF2481DRAFT_137953 [Aureobasidium subglaciale EXF-2481]
MFDCSILPLASFVRSASLASADVLVIRTRQSDLASHSNTQHSAIFWLEICHINWLCKTRVAEDRAACYQAAASCTPAMH